MRLLRPALIAGAALAFAPVARAADEAPAQVPPGGVGLVSLWAGARWVPQGAFLESLGKNGLSVVRRPAVQPSVLLPFGYRVDHDWAVQIEFGYGLDSFAFADGGTLGVRTITLLIGFERTLQFTPRLEGFVGAGTGYHLSSVERVQAGEKGTTSEANATGFYAAAGLRYAVTDGWGLALQERYALAYAGLEGLGALNVGGSTTALGLYYVWRD